jgi:hypothetical protein
MPMSQQTLVSSNGSPAASPAAPSRGTIVIADDDLATLMLLWQVLSKAHFTVRACENGQLDRAARAPGRPRLG